MLKFETLQEFSTSVCGTLLKRFCISKKGTTYTHTCELDTLKEVAHLIDDCQIYRRRDIIEITGAPSSQVHVALQFLIDRCSVDYDEDDYLYGPPDVYADAMLEFEVLKAFK
tara:strand:+ start:223 stop:558 length:336 start_codon:yes stop_codon:yes gene_type:complete